MPKVFLVMALFLVGCVSFAWAAADDDDDSSPASDPFTMTATAGGEFPVTLKASTKYNFAFEAFNKTGASNAIYRVDVTLPSPNYAVDSGSLVAPTALHTAIGSWSVQFVQSTSTITWEFRGMVSSVEVGDIEEGQDLSFPFTATTDAKATDGFPWVLTGDLAGSAPVTGTITFAAAVDDDASPTDDDESPTDDDEASPTPTSSNGSSSGCGC